MAVGCGIRVFTILLLIYPAYCYIEGLYCGPDNCYDILSVQRDSTKGEITKAYRKLARKWHPDMHKTQESKLEAEEMFQRIANAYEVLRDNESRDDYDYMLDNPEEYYHHYYKYYRRRMAPKVDVRIVIVATISIISIIQYWSAYSNYNTAINYLLSQPKYRQKAQEIAIEQGLLGNGKKRKDRYKTKEELRNEENEILKGILKDKMDIRGGYSPAKITNVLWLRIILLPYHIYLYIAWYISWIWRFTINKEEYGDEEKHYLIRKFMGISQGQYDAIEDDERETFFQKELWIKEKYTVWKEKKEADMKSKLSSNSKYKQYKRYMKKGGAGQITFGPE